VIFTTHTEAENAVKALQHSGFDMKKISIVGKGYHTEEHVVGYYNCRDRMSLWGTGGAFWGAMWGILFGSAFFFVPGIGPLVVAGPLVTAIVDGLQGAVIAGGLSAFGAALYSIGIPKDSILDYETEIGSEKFLVLVHGSEDEVTKGYDVLAKLGHEVNIHSA
jgi:uncharacterized membrane protein